MPIVLTELLGVLYLAGVLAAVLVALFCTDRERRADARKVLRLLLSVLPRFPRHRVSGRQPRDGPTASHGKKPASSP